MMSSTGSTKPLAVKFFPAARLPGIFIVGAAKSGTTAMSDYLGAHPDIFMARKEMHVFGSDLQFAPHFYRRNLTEYAKEFRDATNQRLSGEASVWYLLSRNAATEIHQFNPDARILIMLREPVEMMYSLYHQFLYDGNEHLATFEDALAAEEGRRAGKLVSRQAYLPQGLLYREAARYSDQVRRYFEIFGRERVHVILYDDFAADTAGTYRRALEFLEVAPDFQPDFKIVNGNKGVRSPALRAFLRNPRIWSAALAIRRVAPEFVFTTMQQVEARLRKFNTSPEKRAPLSTALHAQLKRAFAPEVERLSELLGRDLTPWTEDPSQPRRQAETRAATESSFA